MTGHIPLHRYTKYTTMCEIIGSFNEATIEDFSTWIKKKKKKSKHLIATFWYNSCKQNTNTILIKIS